MNKEIEINGIKYVPKSTIVKNVKAKSVKGMDFCIVRTYSAGVFAGYFNRKIKGKEGTIYNSRRLWYWEGAASLSQLAMDGTSNPSKCKFPTVVSETDLKEIIEVIPCTEKAKDSILGVDVWSK